MKRFYSSVLLLAVLFSLLYSAAPAQSGTYGNEWIDASKTYYRFKTARNGLYRIPKTTLDALGIPGTVTGDRFMLFYKGQEVPIYVSSSGSLGGSDYIEFYGIRNDGSADDGLYPSNAAHANDKRSLFSDSAAYFLCYDNQNNHLRYTDQTTPIPGTPPPAEPWCWATTGNYYKGTFLRGVPATDDPNFKYQFQSSAFSKAEGFVEASYPPGTSFSIFLATPNAVASGANAVFNIALIATSYTNLHPLKVLINNQQVVDTTYGRYETRKFNRSFSPSVLSNNTEVRLNTTSPSGDYDLWGVAAVDIRYPRNFDVNGLDYFEFRLDPSSSQRYLVFQNFNNGSSPRLYDLTSGKWYLGDVSGSQTRFLIAPSFTESNFVLVGSSSSNISSFSTGKLVQFTDYSNTANQGNYLIISHRSLMQPLGGQNMVQEFANYRSSTAGGSYTVRIADVENLYDQFGYGISYHPLSIRRFLKYAYDTWTVKPDYAFFIGRGLLYHKIPTYLQNPATYTYPIVPTYGDPGSDADYVNFGPSNQQVICVGRLSAWNTQQVANYLNKVKAFETAQKTPVLPSAITELWKKKVLHIAGASDRNLQLQVLLPTLNNAKGIISDTSYGGMVTTVAKDNTNPIDPTTNQYVDSLINAGLSMITFFGHASSTGFDYNINEPENYTNSPQLPLLTALGCDIAQIFELSNIKTISERYVDAQNGGSIITIAADNLGFTNFHPPYLYALYRSVSQQDYLQTVGQQTKRAYNTVNSQFLTASDYNFFFAHLESMLLQGDPAVRLYSRTQPDYHVSNNSVSSIPANVTTSLDSFRLKIVSYNLARAVRDTVRVKVEHTAPSGTTTTVALYNIPNLFVSDTSYVWVPLNKVADIGLNKYKVTIDDNSRFNETNESNNTATLDIFIYSDNLIPVYPREYGIVYQQGVTLKASTLNPFRPMGRYRMEIDTTELFNSPQKQSTLTNSLGGVIKWTPTLSMQDSVVYYWRAAFDSSVNGNYNWGNSSFIYLANGSEGWNQSHYYQYLDDGIRNMTYGEDRRFRYELYDAKVKIFCKIMGGNADVDKNKIQMNEVDIQRSGCVQSNSLQILVIDSMTGQNWKNSAASAAVIGCNAPCSGGGRGVNVFEFTLSDPVARNNARKFLKDSIPNGNYVFIKNCVLSSIFVDAPATSWMNDTLAYGSGNSLYHQLRSMGFDQIDSLYGKRPMILACKKGDGSWPLFQQIGQDLSTEMTKEFIIKVNKARGTLYSTTLGPALEWKNLLWRTSALDQMEQNDTVRVRIYGIDANNQETILYTTTNRDTSLQFISAASYPNLRLEWESYDTLNRSCAQLNYWRVLYSPVPEAALNPAAHLVFTDSLNVGQMMNFSVAVENLNGVPMDSMLVRYKVIDANNTTHTLASRRYKKLAAANDTLHASINFDPAAYPGQNIFFVEANPDHDQPEQYHPNNLGYLPFRIIKDERNPLLDVTFDGVHILDRDIVSATPFIKIMLKDENEYLALDDSSLVQLQISYPDEFNTKHKIPFDGSTCKFIPATLQNGKKNEAYIEYRPRFTQRSNDNGQNIFTLYVSGKDRTGNRSGRGTEYQVAFEVVYESAITHVLNYPNPFSTSTAFVFTLTGSQLPSQFKIQILSVTGKVVREITKDELGPIRIGRNITEYKWDGRDQYGQLLGNGVYLYRVVASINGKDMDTYNPGTNSKGDGAGAAVDKFFKNGYGKMYIMR